MSNDDDEVEFVFCDDEVEFVFCDECGWEQVDMGHSVACEECGARMPTYE